MNVNICGVSMLSIACTTVCLAGEKTPDYPIHPVPFTQVSFQDCFWAPRMETNRLVSIPFAFGKCEENGRMSNFDIAAGAVQGEHRGQYPFDDTDPYKIIEGASYALQLKKDPQLDRYLDDLIARIGAAQEADGYIYTCRSNKSKSLESWYGPERWSNLGRSHELYNAGHLYEAAVAHYQATGKRSLLDVALKNADLIERTFGPGKNEQPPGHQIIEMGLARLYRVTGEKKYIDLAKFFLDTRGRVKRNGYSAYNQDHKPVVEQDEAVGHAVRAVYMYAGMADVAALSDDIEMLKAIDRLWQNVVSKKLYLTGGIGATSSGEAFGANYELPNMSAYCETCAAIGNVYWNHRLFLLHGEAKYIDVMERTLYNGLISGVSLDGRLFFYPNPLESQGQHARSPWFGCACCPGNITRFIASVPGYAYAVRDDEIFVNLYAAGRAALKVDKTKVQIEQETRYPWEGKVFLRIKTTKKEKFSLRLRIPGWAVEEPVPGDLYRFAEKKEDGVKLLVNGETLKVAVTAGYAVIRRKWGDGDVVELELPMPVRRVLAHDKVEADRGRVALQRGPLVYCAEWPDFKDGHVLNMFLADDVALESSFRKELLNGVQVITGEAVFLKPGAEQSKPVEERQDFLAIPYYAWAHRGKGEMSVWLARNREVARPLTLPTVASLAQVSTSYGKNVEAVNDQREPESSGDHDCRFYHWWPHKGTQEWVQYDFAREEKLSEVEVYWFDDTGRGECRTPESWKLLYRDGDEWKPVLTEDNFGVEKDRFNGVTFKPVKTRGLRIEVQSRKDFAGGIHEWKVR